MDAVTDGAIVAKQKDDKAPPAWPVARHSPFSDGYDIEAERRNLQDLIDADEPDALDPRWDRLVELEQRERQLTQMQAADRLRNQADRLVPDPQAMALTRLGRLVTEQSDTLTIHTREAYRLFMGRSAGPNKDRHAIVGARRAASILRTFFYLSEKDNPYADWMLVRAMAAITALRAALAQKQQEMDDVLRQRAERGLNYHVLASTAPKALDLSFRTPYGYALAELMCDVDYIVRMMKTFQTKAIWTGMHTKTQVYLVSRRVRGLFANFVRPERILMNPDMQPLSRVDWLPTADEAGKRRVAAAAELLGPVPKAVFVAALQPDHTRRHIKLKPEELRLLARVIDEQEAALASAQPAPEDDEDDTAATQKLV
jgi:integrating conjugative element protein (TIGR03761 family)